MLLNYGLLFLSASIAILCTTWIEWDKMLIEWSFKKMLSDPSQCFVLNIVFREISVVSEMRDVEESKMIYLPLLKLCWKLNLRIKAVFLVCVLFMSANLPYQAINVSAFPPIVLKQDLIGDTECDLVKFFPL